MFAKNYTDSELFSSTAFTRKLAESTAPIAVFRKALEQGSQILAQRFQANNFNVDTVLQRAWLVDQILTHAWHQYAWTDLQGVALIAVGGYGRQELLPSSDIDLMILFKNEINDVDKENVESFLIFLWDIGLEVGHSVRTLDECEAEARADVTVITNLIESRLLCGSDDVFDLMQERIGPSNMWSSREFFEAKLHEQEKRHHKFYDTAYNLEPNIKEGPGGLRDIQTLIWVAKRHFGASKLHDLVQHGFLSESEFIALTEAQEFLWRLRSLLHNVTKRREDRLGFDYQRTLAKILGYEDDDARLGVENFMKTYYRTAREVTTLNSMLLNLFEEALLYDGPREVKPLNKRFRICNDYIEVTDEHVFDRYPFALLEIFLLFQQHEEVKGIRASTARLIRHYSYLIDDDFHRDLRARSLFFEIIRQPHGLTRAFRAMTRYGVLPAYLPAFGRIVGQMQYDLFHVYTVDQHTLFVIRNLRRFVVHPNEFPQCSKIMNQLPKPELLYIAGLFHDIAKGRGGDHSVLGQDDARAFCQAHGLSDRDTRLVVWLVREHLTMSMTAQRHDISDPDVINAFARKVEELSRLDYLYLLTVADIRGTNPTLWNGWKASLLSDLYHRTKQALMKGLASPVDKTMRINQIKDLLRQSLSHIPGERIETLWKNLEDDYFLRADPMDLVRETLGMLHKEENEPLVMMRKETRGSTEFLVYAPDHGNLFANLVFCLERLHITILDAHSVPTANDHGLLTYSVLEEDGKSIISEERVEKVKQALLKAASKTTLEFNPVRRRRPRQLKHFSVPTRLSFKKDMLHNHTLLEVITTDGPGVLSCIVQALVQCGVHVKSARIATFGSRVEDLFTVTDERGKALSSPDQFDCLQEHLVELLENQEDSLPEIIHI